uniref:Uncharacterized protein n=1 Tax=Populus davidiana TaxID=266767 RepID=A0A6M2EMF3_9ROSI
MLSPSHRQHLLFPPSPKTSTSLLRPHTRPATTHLPFSVINHRPPHTPFILTRQNQRKNFQPLLPPISSLHRTGPSSLTTAKLKKKKREQICKIQLKPTVVCVAFSSVSGDNKSPPVEKI